MAEPLFLGIEIGGTKLQLGLGRGDGRILDLKRLTIVPADGASGIRAQIAGAVGPLAAGRGEPIAAVGIGFGGPVDAGSGVVTKSHQVAGWDGFALGAWARETLGVPVVSVHNDADTSALGEASFGAGVGLSPILYVTIGSGIGGGLVIDGKIYRGAGAGATEIGHLWVAAGAYDGSFETYSSLEGVASGWAIGRAGAKAVHHYRDGYDATRMTELSGGDPDRVTGQVVAEAARLGDFQAGLVIDRATTAMGRALAHAVTLLAPRLVILGGGVSLIDDDLWLDPIRKALDERVFPPFRGTFDVVTASLGEEVVVHGALALARDAYRVR